MRNQGRKNSRLTSRSAALREARAALVLALGATLCAALPLAGDMSNAAEAQSTSNVSAPPARAPRTAPGQTATRLSDGRWVLIGGASAGTPTNAVIVEGTPSRAAPTLSLRYPRTGHTATLLPDGTVAVVGGVGRDGQIVAPVEILDIAGAETRIATESALLPRANHSATLLTDGRVLIAGGESKVGAPRADAQIWNPRTGDVETIDGVFGAAREGHSATLLSNGSVLITGGKDALGAAVVGAERFDATTGRITHLTADESALALANSNARAAGVEAVLPVADAHDAPVDTRVAIRLSRPVDASAVANGMVTVVGPAGAADGQLVVAEGGRLLFFTPAAELLPNATYTVFVKGAFPLAMSTFTTETLSVTPAARAAATAGNGSISLTDAPEASRSRLRTAATNERKRDAQAAAKRPQDKKTEDEEDDEVEDWLPGPEHRHGNWRVLGLRNEPHTRQPLAVPAALAAAAHVPALAGRVVRLNGRPIAGVPVSIGSVSAQTDEQGRFLLSGVPQGPQVLRVDGARVQHGGRPYLTHYLQVQIAKSKTTRMPEPIYLAREDREHAVSFPSPTDREIIVTNPAIPGLELHIPKGAVLRTPDGKIVTQLSITPLPLNRVPFPVPMGFPVYFAVSPAGTFVDNSGSSETRGIRVLYPNYINAPPGTRVVFWNYDPNGAGWQVYGHGTVSADGAKVVPDEGVTQATLMSFGWGLENQGNDPQEGPPPGSCAMGGDPVDCATGLFTHSAVDLFVSDTLPIVIARTYRQNDSVSRDFGIGSNHLYGMFLSNPTANTTAPTQIDLILPDGGRVRFNKISGSGVDDVIFEHTATPSAFQGARLQISTVTHAWEMTLRDQSVLVFEPHSPNRLIGTRDRFGNTLTISRSNGRIAQVISPHGRSITFAYDNANRITGVTDNAGRSVGYQYDSVGRLWKVTDPDGKVEQYGYDTANRMTTITDRRGNVMVTNVYDANGRVQQQTLADGAVWQFSYVLDANGRVVQTDVTDPRGFVRRDVFNSSGYLTQQTLALGQPEERTTTFAREPVTNLLLSVTDFLGRVTKYSYDFRGNPTSVTRLFGTASAVTESFSYDPASGRLTSYTDALSHQVTYNYDSRGDLVSIVDPLNHSASATYDSEGNLTSITDPLGHTTQFRYDAGDLSAVTNPLGQTVSMFTDLSGRPTGYSDPVGRNVRIGYDALDRVTQVSDPLGQTMLATYDEHGNLRTFRDPRNLAAHGFTYDARNRMHTYTDPLGATETYEYDGLGNLTSKTDRKGQTTTFLYDPLNRIRKVTYADSSTLTVTWDDANRTVTLADSSNGTTTQIYDDLGRLTRESSPQGQIDYQYDAAGRRTQMTIAGIATPITYDYDAADRPTQVAQGSIATVFGYDAADRRTSTTLPNGVIASWTYNDASEITGIAYDKGGTHIGDLAYTYDASGRRSGVSGSLARLAMPTTVGSASYDAANRLSSWGGTALSYDNNGSLTAYGATTYGWNARNELIATSEGSSTFSYDALGRRRARTVSGVTTGYLHDGQNPATVGGELMLAGQSIDEFYAQITGGIPATYLQDALGSTLAVTDVAGAVSASYSYGLYGDVTKTGAANAAFQFTARERDLPGLQYNRARYFSPATGRFISEDPIGLGGGANLYAYAGGNPASRADPSGLYFGWDDAAFIVGGAVVGVVGQAIGDALSGQLGSWQDYVGSAVGGAAGGEALLYLGPVGAGAIGGAVTNLTKQGLKNLTGAQCGFDPKTFVGDTVIGAATGFVPGIRISGITAGRGSMNAIYRQIVTKAQNGTISRISPTTALKMFTGRAVSTGLFPGTGAAAVAGLGEGRLLGASPTECGCN